MNLQPEPATVLVIDDNITNLKVATAHLGAAGFEVLTARDGRSGVERALQMQPDLILLDVELPDLDGFEACRQIKQDERTKEIPIIFMTVLNAVEDKLKGFAAGGVDYIPKPFQSEELLARVNTHVTLYQMMRSLNELTRELQREQQRSEQLLLNILPATIARQLKAEQRPIANCFDDATVFFADIVRFTERSARMEPETMVAWLDEIFSIFDEFAGRYGIEKIKTIGDCYMAAAGIPQLRSDHAEAIAEFALDIRAAMAQRRDPNGAPLQLRIGVNTGPIVAGVIGTKKFIYDVWGDAVNLASRMESDGLADAIQVSQETYQRLKDRYVFEPRGAVPIKGKGTLETYLLLARR
jgi:adenylate cyclase